MLETEEFPTGVSYLYSSLSNVKVDDLSHVVMLC